MQTEPVFSVVTIAFNNRAGLARTLASVDAQQCRDFEHIIVDGGSSDGSVELLAEAALQASGQRRWSSQPDGGIYDAMNKGISKGSGRLVVMMNAGDCLADDGTLAKVKESWTEHGWRWAYGAIRITDEDGRVQGAYTFDPFRPRRFVAGLSWIPHASVFMDRRLVREIGDYDRTVGTSADQELLLRALRVSPPHVITDFLAHFEAGGVSTRVTPRGRELAWHGIRRTSGSLLGGTVLSDRVISEVLGIRGQVKRLASGMAKR